MGIFDKVKRSATKAVDEHGDKIAKGLDKAGDAADKQTKGRHGDKIDKGVGAAKDALDKLDGRDDDIGKHQQRP
jgi:MT0933-like antitoxin protein